MKKIEKETEKRFYIDDTFQLITEAGTVQRSTLECLTCRDGGVEALSRGCNGG
jgi:hypothetical protein